MKLNVLKSSVRIWQHGHTQGEVSLSFDVAPADRHYIEVGDNYVFRCSSDAWLHRTERTLIGATVSVTDDPDVLANLGSTVPDGKRPLVGKAFFYPERVDVIDGEPAKLHFLVVVKPNLLREMLAVVQRYPGGAWISLGIEHLEFGWEPDGSHLIWKLPSNGDDSRPLTSFSYSVDQFRTSEGAIRDEEERWHHAELADSPNDDDRKLLASLKAEKNQPDQTPLLLKQCHLLLLLLVATAVLIFIQGGQ